MAAHPLRSAHPELHLRTGLTHREGGEERGEGVTEPGEKGEQLESVVTEPGKRIYCVYYFYFLQTYVISYLCH